MGYPEVMTQARGARPVRPRRGSPAQIEGSSPSPGPAQPTVYSTSSRLVFYAAVLLIFTHFARPFDTFLVGYKLPAIICGIGILVAAISGSFKLLASPVGISYICLLCWFALAVPSSYWMGGSAQYIIWHVRFLLILMLVVAVAGKNPNDLLKLCGVLAFSCALHLMVNGSETAGRLSLSGTFGNSDDVALLAGFAIPFWVLVAGRVNSVAVRGFLLAGGCGYLLILIGRTATRAAIPALIAMLAVYFVRGNASRKMGVVAFALLGLVAALIILPQSSIDRLASITNAFTLSGSDLAAQSEVDDSMKERKDLVQDAIEIALKHPIFGIGPGQFVEYRYAKVKQVNGRAKPYLPTHNTYLEIASDAGLPAIAIYLVFLGSIYLAIRRSEKANKAQAQPNPLVSQLCLCTEAALAYFAVCAAFMTCDKHPHQFVVAGMAIALSNLGFAKVAAKAPVSTGMELALAPQLNIRRSSPAKERVAAPASRPMRRPTGTRAGRA